MEDVGPVGQNCCQNHIKYLGKDYTTSRNRTSHGWPSGRSLPRTPPSQPGLELLIEDLGNLVLSLPRTPPPQELELPTEDCTGTGILKLL